MAKRRDTKLYFAFTASILVAVGASIWGAFTIFDSLLTYKSLVQGLSLYFEGHSGTMTPEFDVQWLLFSAKVFIFVLWLFFVAIVVLATFGAVMIHRKLKIPIKEKRPEEFITAIIFSQYKDVVDRKLESINKEIDDMNTIISDSKSKIRRNRTNKA